METVKDFKQFETYHCVTGSMRHIYEHHNYPISEDLLLGLGEGVGFIYWQQKGAPPFIGGRAQPEPSMEELSAQRTGVRIQRHSTSSARKAEKNLLELLTAGEPVMLQVDMGFLPYFDFGETEYHFGGHVVVACGYDPDSNTVLIADREDGLQPVSMEALEQARGSTYKPFPPKHTWWTFDFSEMRPPTADGVNTAIVHQAKAMLEPPIRNFGVAGIRKAAERIPKWADTMDSEALKWAVFNMYIFISPVGGTGGGTFRYMFSRFLREAASITKNACLNESSDTFNRIGDSWEEIGAWAKNSFELDDLSSRLKDCVPRLERVAELEQTAWQTLHDTIV